VRAWFYPGDNYGNEFVYPESKALAEASPPPAQMASKLPKTAGSLPLLALIGLLPLGTAGLLRRAATALRVENR
jgi:hypothetical protein